MCQQKDPFLVSNLRWCKTVYFAYLPYFFAYSTTVGASIGWYTALSDRGRISGKDVYIITTAWIGMGMITGITYPISYTFIPVLTGVNYLANRV